ncbi:actin depolymerizing protein [Dentipellis sp. KUC8613]|nr:actin depolymerizing protein [Dentipellis sp. KUC8613]
MSATSGIGLSEELVSDFSRAVTSRDVRFLKISIRNETLVSDGTFPSQASLESDLAKLNTLLEDNIPAYVLVRLDDPPTEWLSVHYVPDTAKVRDKMLYASTRNTLTKGLGSTHFTDTIFATSKDDVTPAAYAAHKRHVAAPAPMSAREKEMADVLAAEKQAGGGAYGSSRARQNHIGTGVGLKWSPDVEDAVKELATADNRLVTITIDPSSETAVLKGTEDSTADELGDKLPPSDPTFAFFAWSPAGRQRQIVFIYSCPSSSPIKHRMLYSSGSSSVYQAAKALLPPNLLAGRKIETSDPKELNDSLLQAELAHSNNTSPTPTPGVTEETKSFARPRGPARRYVH